MSGYFEDNRGVEDVAETFSSPSILPGVESTPDTDIARRIATILDTAESEASRIREGAQSEASRIVREAHSRAAERVEELTREPERIRAEAEQQARALISSADHQARTTISTAEHRAATEISEAERQAQNTIELAEQRSNAICTLAEQKVAQMEADMAVRRDQLLSEIRSLADVRDEGERLASQVASSIQSAADDLVRKISSVPNLVSTDEPAAPVVAATPVETAAEITDPLDDESSTGFFGRRRH